MDALDRLHSHRPLLYVLAAIGGVGLNGVFLGYAFARPEVMMSALANPVSLVFVLEAFLMMGFLAWLIQRAGMQDPGWRLFIVLSLVGSLAFSVPAFLLLHLRKRGAASVSRSASP